ncbi:MAG: 2-oxoacid:ferredoxin oxidoreductase subunit beta, partial [Acidimicrobiaceae bacterium]|nr:2-oxoacid:ferredoxin oxidoreductase subunit beta [Acidimicrobiaceae bacterium]
AFAALTKRDARDSMLIDLRHGEPVRFGADDEFGVVMDGGRARVVKVADVGVDALVVHDEADPDPSVAFALSRLANTNDVPTPIGVFRAVERSEYGSAVTSQIAASQSKAGPGDLHKLLHSRPTWQVA